MIIVGVFVYEDDYNWGVGVFIENLRKLIREIQVDTCR